MKLIALDLDGTLLNSDKVVSQRNFAALSRAAEQGHVIVPATGRALRAIPEQVMAFPFLHYAITINGAKVSDTRSGAVLLRAEIALDTCLRLLDFAARYDEIVEFAELKDFMHVPVKNYSSGMRARLGFAIATAVDPQVLILDEVLSVGDARFRAKSEKRVMSMFENNVTVLFVSHSTEQVRRLCNKAIILDHGKMIASGTSQEVCDIYDRMVKGIK